MPAFPKTTVALSLLTGTAAFSTAKNPPTLRTLTASTALARAAAAFSLRAAHAGNHTTTTNNGELNSNDNAKLEVAGTAMQSCLMWNIIYHPTQAGPFVQVSRSFTQHPYELFEWDTYFGSLMLSFDRASLPYALSSIIQITKSKTLGPRLDGKGFVPGYSKGGRWLSEDRTERSADIHHALRTTSRTSCTPHPLHPLHTRPTYLQVVVRPALVYDVICDLDVSLSDWFALVAQSIYLEGVFNVCCGSAMIPKHACRSTATKPSQRDCRELWQRTLCICADVRS